MAAHGMDPDSEALALRLLAEDLASSYNEDGGNEDADARVVRQMLRDDLRAWEVMRSDRALARRLGGRGGTNVENTPQAAPRAAPQATPRPTPRPAPQEAPQAIPQTVLPITRQSLLQPVGHTLQPTTPQSAQQTAANTTSAVGLTNIAVNSIATLDGLRAQRPTPDQSTLSNLDDGEKSTTDQSTTTQSSGEDEFLRGLTNAVLEHMEAALFSTTSASCIACCTGLANDAITLECDHQYCHDCLRSLFEHSFSDEELFPPRCCKKPIPVDLLIAHGVYRPDVQDRFEEKRVEFSTTNRVYCANTTCGTFVPPRKIRDGLAACAACKTTTCAACKKEGPHAGDCPGDADSEAALALAKKEGWQQCGRCQRLIELTVGCNHMTCKCRHQFCYVCGVEWKKCACLQWDEARLFNAAERRVEGAAVPAGQREAAIHREARRLRVRHDCGHNGRFSKETVGSLRCEYCNDTLSEFILQCDGCPLRICVKCKRNRL